MYIINGLMLAIIVLLAPFAVRNCRYNKDSLELYYHLDGGDTLRYRLKSSVALFASAIYFGSYLRLIITNYL